MGSGWILVYSLLAGFAVVTFAALPRKQPLSVNLSVYFCITILETSLFTILMLNMGRFEESNRLELYFCRELCKFILYPFLLLLFANLWRGYASAIARAGTAIGSLTALMVVLYSLVRIGEVTFKHWNLWLCLPLFAFLMASAWGVQELIIYIHRRKEGA